MISHKLLSQSVVNRFKIPERILIPFGVRRYFLRNTRRKFSRAMLPRAEAQKLPAGYYKSVMMDSYKVQSSQLPKFRDENTNSAR